MIIITFGTFDIIHVGHLHMLKNIKNNQNSQINNKIIIGLCSDALHNKLYGNYPINTEQDRLNILNSFTFIDNVFIEEAFHKRYELILKYKADLLVASDKWSGKLDHFKQYCDVKYFKKIPNISKEKIIEKIKNI